ncbi:TonB-dependent receptor [Leptolyngbya sp. FACHB-261]|uniref:TonB-dependent receptor n=1 Tax=Leptolyngbya sp. FACHB-261 TaxID=2692806 RepID=UPI00168246ED|nr:TonB-dependent receptor [Leptolyngbya sp. FACHB-261]MBD2101588.1 TonB-dependent receptor [Leptolyngbya sp. FACHB-261]
MKFPPASPTFIFYLLFFASTPLALLGTVPAVWANETKASEVGINEPETSETRTVVAQAGGVSILSPQTSEVSEAATNLVIRYPAATQVEVTVNQKPLDPSLPNQVVQDEAQDDAQNLVIQSWPRIPLETGENVLRVRALPDGPATNVTVTVKNTAPRLELFAANAPQIPADGRSTLTLQGQLSDASGARILQDTLVTLTTSAGKFIGADQDTDRPGFQVIARQGEFTAQLQSTLEAQKVRVRASLDPKQGQEQRRQEQQNQNQNQDQIEAETQVEFVTNLRTSLVSGSLSLRIGNSGSDFYRGFRDFLNPELLDDGTQVDFNAAVFATGRLGEWLFTGAWNNQRPLNQTCDNETRLFRDLQFCDQQYPVYGDSSTVDYLTPSIDSVYVRLERTSPVPGAEPDYAMWGDYNTEEFARASQLFSATTRQLHGFKLNYNLGNFQASVLYGNNVEGFQRDTIAPDGTSGYYFLSRRLLVEGSENVFLEIEEINRPGTVLERKTFSRGVDYDIDYDRGTILFRRPILATEFDPFGTTLVRRIVATYQYEGRGNTGTDLYAGRLQYNFSQEFNRESWAGISYLRDNQGDRNFELYGFDTLIPLGENSQFIAEVARSRNDSVYRGDITGTAYRFELNAALSQDLRGRLYYRDVDEDFSNNATISFTPGQTRYGASVNARIGPSTTFEALYDRESNYGISSLERTTFNDLFNPGIEPRPGSRVDNTLTTISAGIQQRFGAAELSLNWVNRDREDRIGDDDLDGNASQLVSRLTIPILQNLSFRAQNELNLGESDPLYPDRTVVGLNWAVMPGVSVQLNHQFYTEGRFARYSVTSLDTILEHSFSEDTKMTGRYSLLGGANGTTMQGAVGLNHRWTIAPGLRINLTYERLFGDVFGRTAAGDRYPQPYAVSQSAASLGLRSGHSYSVGFEYTDNPALQASARYEHRSDGDDDNTVISAAVTGKVSPSLTALLRYQQANSSNQLLTGLGDTSSVRLGLAYRDLQSDRFNALLRYEYRKNPSVIPDTLLFGNGTGSQDHTFALEAIYAPNWQWEFYGKYALRSSTTDFARNFSNNGFVSLAQFRTAYQLSYNMDLAGEVRWISQNSTDYNELGFVLETGYYLTPNLRLAAGYSFGRVSDREFDSRSDSGPYVTLTVKLNELFNGFGLQRVAPRQQQESQVTQVSAPTGETP